MKPQLPIAWFLDRWVFHSEHKFYLAKQAFQAWWPGNPVILDLPNHNSLWIHEENWQNEPFRQCNLLQTVTSECEVRLQWWFYRKYLKIVKWNIVIISGFVNAYVLMILESEHKFNWQKQAFQAQRPYPEDI